jgi:GT2 family glycosyltransferase
VSHRHWEGPYITVPLVSIIIVNFRAYQELGACLQTLQPDVVTDLCEVIVVDNATCSPLFAPLVERYSWIRAVPLPTNVGFAAANNLGARDALEHRSV